MGPCHPRTLSGAPQSPATGRRGSEVASPGVRGEGVRRQNVITEDTSQQCTEMRSQYLRSQCRDNGFLTVQRNRVLVQTTGLNTTHVEGRRVTMKNVTHIRIHCILAFSHSVRTSYFSWMDGCRCKDEWKKNVCLLHDIMHCASLCHSMHYIEISWDFSNSLICKWSKHVDTWKKWFLININHLEFRYDDGIRLGNVKEFWKG